MPTPYTGQCLCGAVKFTIASEPATVISCFCNHCQKGAGGPNQVIAKFSRADVTVSADTDAITKYILKDTSSGSPKEKHFCRQCGCTLWTVPASAKGTTYIIRTSLLEGG
jgi:hypothetical protein